MVNFLQRKKCISGVALQIAFTKFIDFHPYGFFSKAPTKWQKCIDNNKYYILFYKKNDFIFLSKHLKL